MYKRILEKKLRDERGSYPVIAVTGPRQSGKTTLVQKVFQDHQYLLLEDPELKARAKEDPKSLFAQYTGSLILDEVQKTPELLSYIQGIVDNPSNKRSFVLTGSENLFLSEKISQTLAGRVRIYNLLTLSQEELKTDNIHRALFYGGYPRIHNEGLDPSIWLAQYYATYVQRDVRSVLNISDLDQFDRYMRIIASRTGQLIDLASIGGDCGITQPTSKAWMSVLKATFVLFTLEPHFKNFGKRIIKSPKSYFYDTGLLCYLLRIKTIDQLTTHPLYGSIFENWVISERLKKLLNRGEESNLYFWRDQKGHEIDLIADFGKTLFPTEIKSSQTFNKDFINNIEYFNNLQNLKNPSGECIYGGLDPFDFKNIQITPWMNV